MSTPKAVFSVMYRGGGRYAEAAVETIPDILWPKMEFGRSETPHLRVVGLDDLVPI